MEKVKKSALRRGFIKYVLAAFFGAAAVSVIVIVLCSKVRVRLVPNSDMVYLNWGERGIENSRKAELRFSDDGACGAVR